MNKYLCKWTNGENYKYLEWDDFQIQAFTFFTDDNGYDDKNRDLIKRLNVGDRLDLSDGISQYHEIERVQ
jgi:hypothetical protein